MASRSLKRRATGSGNQKEKSYYFHMLAGRDSLAEREGFEPSVEFPLHTLSKRAPSTTRTSLRLESATCERSEDDYGTRRSDSRHVAASRWSSTGSRDRGGSLAWKLCQASECPWITYRRPAVGSGEVRAPSMGSPPLRHAPPESRRRKGIDESAALASPTAARRVRSRARPGR